MVPKELCILLGSENSGDPFQVVSRLSNQKVPEIRIQVTDGQNGNSPWHVVIAYEGNGAFSIRSQRGSRIIVRGGKAFESSLSNSPGSSIS